MGTRLIFQTAVGLFFLFVLPKQLDVLWVFARIRSVMLQATEDRKIEGNTHIPPYTNYDSSIIITSSIIPTHPNIAIINKTLHSLEMLQGLPDGSPIFVTVDGLDPAKSDNTENRQRLQDYVRNLRLNFRNDDRVKILTSYTFGHLTNSLKMAIELVDTKYVYVVQHDFPFSKPINHTALVESMKKNPLLHIVRFNKRKNAKMAGPGCDVVVHSSGIDFVLNKWSDNNHFTTKNYYFDMLERLGPSPRAPESPMMYAQNSNCSLFGQYLYGGVGYGPYIEHLDGRNTDN
eukprot:CAMPEP_0181029696 /NCGR_PEP_ID=MMETSP1070-20121207/5335_1 /TAXON_ID=265543 /ORGANISM="Minutocellus polymorphus, Strain NH13" /LENGTH=288 /DNA_ID=CAMNT_0023107021 /DNA_START=1778 /DNA_END=2644 /DNA_ORIENTATION=-